MNEKSQVDLRNGDCQQRANITTGMWRINGSPLKLCGAMRRLKVTDKCGRFEGKRDFFGILMIFEGLKGVN